MEVTNSFCGLLTAESCANGANVGVDLRTSDSLLFQGGRLLCIKGGIKLAEIKPDLGKASGFCDISSGGRVGLN